MSNRHSHPATATVTTVTDATFETFTTGGYSVVDFYATWCGPCHQLAPIFDQAPTRHPDLSFGRLDVDQSPQTAARLGILSIPTVVVFDPSGKEIDRMLGATGVRRLDAFLAEAATPAA